MPIAQDRLQVLQVCKLLQCVRNKDKVQVEKLTLNGIPHLINYNDPSDGLTAIHVAAIANDDDMIEFLLGLGAHPDVMDFKGRSASMRAAEYGHIQCLQKLANARASMTLNDLEGKGVLFYCICPTQRHEKCLEIAVNHGAEVNNRAIDGTPLLVKACETAVENEDMCITLIKKGADPNAKHDKYLKTPLMMASESGSERVARAILEAGGKVDMLDYRQNHAAHFAAKGGFLGVLAVMTGYNANFDQVNMDGNTPIHFGAMAGHGVCCKFLSQRGCNPKPKNKEGLTARIIAKEESHKEALKECRKAEKSFGKIVKNNEPWAIQLYDWIYERQTKLAEMFAKYDPDDKGVINKDDFSDSLQGLNAPIEDDEMKKLLTIYDKNRDGKIDFNDFLTGKKFLNKNYLMSAFEGKKKKKKKGGRKGKKKGKFKLTMPICVEPEGMRSEDGGPPQMFIPRHIHFTDTGRFDRDKAPDHPLQDDSAWYLQQPEKTYISITDAAKSNDFDSLRNAFNNGKAVDTKDKYHKTPLMVSCANGNLKMVKFLLDNGAQVNERDNFKWTPLHFACHSGQLDIVEVLLEKGAEMDAVALNGGTPLTRAIESSRIHVVQYLIQRGSKIQTENKKGQTPVDIAKAWADPRVLDIIQKKWDSLPTQKDGKKKGAKKGGGKAKRPLSVPPENKDVGAKGPGRMDDAVPPRKGSILRAASALAGGLEEKEDITYTPLKAWTDQPNTKDLIKDKEVKRERFGWEVDFNDFEMPFNKNVSNTVKEMGGDDDD